MPCIAANVLCELKYAAHFCSMGSYWHAARRPTLSPVVFQEVAVDQWKIWLCVGVGQRDAGVPAHAGGARGQCARAGGRRALCLLRLLG